MKEELQKILEEAKANVTLATALDDVEALRVKFLGKKGAITEILRSMKDLDPEERKVMGQVANETKAKIEALIGEKMISLRDAAKRAKLEAETVDVTEPGADVKLGTSHILTQTINEITNIFMSMGFSVAEGPEVETVYYNFDALNAGPNHPSRDMTDTFYIDEKTILRTQTSPIQVRTLLKEKPPIRVIAPGRVFRCDTPDATHSPMFHQLEGLVVDEGITMADLKGTLDIFAKKLLGESTKTKFRPHHFPFTEPSAEMDVTCFKCGGKGCRMCKGSGWIELLGCGMVHPNVLKVGNVDTEKYTGFAFGMGLERAAMFKHEIDDLRYLYENDVRFIEQFK